MDNIYIGLIIMIILNWYSRYLLQQSIDILNDNQKLSLISLFKESGKYQSIILIALLVVYFILIKQELISYIYLLSIYFLIILLFMIYSYLKNLKILESNLFPEEYIGKFKVSFLMKIIGVLIFFSLIFFDIVKKTIL